LPTGEINVNQAFADFLGYSPEELEGKSWQDLTPAEDIAKIGSSAEFMGRLTPPSVKLMIGG
jgi:PAS domain S-box-containing protein